MDVGEYDDGNEGGEKLLYGKGPSSDKLVCGRKSSVHRTASALENKCNRKGYSPAQSEKA